MKKMNILKFYANKDGYKTLLSALSCYREQVKSTSATSGDKTQTLTEIDSLTNQISLSISDQPLTKAPA